MAKTNLIVCMCVALLAATISASAQNPIANPSFEQGLDSWTAYTYQPSPDAKPAEPVAGCVGDPPCCFNLLHAPAAPDGQYVCGIQSYGTSGNGGVYQSFTCPQGPASIMVSARAYSQKYDGTPLDSGCLVRMGLAPGVVQDRDLVATWVTFPWSDSWHKRTLGVPEAGTYTLFIEAYQPNSSTIMSTLWDKVEFFGAPPVPATSGPTVAADPLNPDTSVTVTWTTDVASTSVVEYGLTPDYGWSAGDSELVTNHSVVLSELSHSSQYYFRVTSAAEGYLDWVSDNLTFQTPIWFSDIVAKIGSDGQDMIIDWHTDVPATSQVEYWSETEPHTFTPEIATLTTTHEVSITSLTEGRQYSFRVLSRNQPQYSDAASAVSTFWTLPPVSPALVNGGFEDIHEGQGHSIYPWVQYATQEGESGYHPIDGLVGPYPAGGSSGWLSWQDPEGPYFPGVRAYEGSYFLGAGANAAFKNGGVFQRVNVNPGDFYTLTVRYLTHTVGGENNYTIVRIGVDPNGGVDRQSDDVKWWSGYSDTNDDQWHFAAVTVTAGASGVATVFLEFQQTFSIQWHVAAVDGVMFGPPLPISIGALKASKGSLGAIFEDKIVTRSTDMPVYYQGKAYGKAYVEEDNRTAGIAVLFPTSGTAYPVAGNKLSVVGALGVYGKEAALLAESWTVDDYVYPLPKPVGMSQASAGKSGPSQPAIFPKSFGLCNVGLRVRLFGRVTWTRPGGATGDVTVYIDDGGKMQDGTMTDDELPVPIHGIRTYLWDKEATTASVGDYIAVTGVLSVELIDLNGWPDSSDYYIYSLLTASPDDWAVF